MAKICGNALRAFVAAFIVALLTLSGASAQNSNPIKIGAEPCPDRRRRLAEQGDQHRARHLARRRQCQGWAVGPPGRARHLRRSEHAGERARHLHQADHRRQSRPAARALRNQLRRAGDADHHPEQEADDQLHCDRHQRQIPIRQILLDGLRRSGRREFLLHRLLRHGGGAEAETGDRRDPRRRRRVRPGRGARRPRGDQEAWLQARL